MIERQHPDISIVRQCELLGLCRSAAYYKPRPVNEEDLQLMRLMDEQYLKTPFFGSRRMTVWLQNLGYSVNRKRVQRLMRQMGLQAIYPKPRLSQAGKGHKIYPYLLKGLKIDRPNQVWATDITYIPLARGFMYLVAIMDWYSRKVLAWRVSNSMESSFCVEALEEAIENYGTPEIFNTDQGSQFTSDDFTSVLKRHQVDISMDGKGCFRDNIFVERLWRSVKYECVYLKAFEGGQSLRQELRHYFNFYNTERFHQGLDYTTPDNMYFKSTKQQAA